MRVSVVVEQRFDQSPDGDVWTSTQFPYSFWQRYLEVFDSVTVIARVRKTVHVPETSTRSSGPGVKFGALPCYVGPLAYLKARQAVKAGAQTEIDPQDAVILRVPSNIAACVVPALKRRNQPYAIEVVGDPYDVFAPGAIKHPLRPLFRIVFTRWLKQQAKAACGACYITERVLQRRYPCPSLEIGISDVQMPVEAYAQTARLYREGRAPFNLITVGSLEQSYKGTDVLIDAVARLVAAGMDLKLNIVGEGRMQAAFEQRASHLGIGQRVRFAGRVSLGEGVRKQLDLADLFVFPSRAEAQGRALIEAMGRALPCVASGVGGIVELLPPEDLVRPGDVSALAAKIREVLEDTARMNRMSARNLAKAREFHDAQLQQSRIAFYRHVSERTRCGNKNIRQISEPSCRS